MTKCAAENCQKQAHSKGLCGTHYQRKRRSNDTSSRPVGLGKGMDWLMNNCQPDHDDCVIWPFYIAPSGYGFIGARGSNFGAHREACRIRNGEAPSKDHEAAHFCGNRACVNAKHLRWATPAENAADRISHGTHLEGEDAGQAKLTNSQAAMIRLDGRRQRDIAADYGVTQKVISLIQQGKSYKSALGMQ